MAMEIPTGQEEEAVYGDAGDGSQRQMDLEIKELKEERDTLKRRVDMERSAVAHALGKSQGDARSFRYDEWDYLNHTYLRAWCRVFEQPLNTDDQDDTAPLKAVIRAYQNTVQRQLEQIRPTGLERIRRVQDGDELDLNAVIEARQDIRRAKVPTNGSILVKKECSAMSAQFWSTYRPPLTTLSSTGASGLVELRGR